MTNPFGCSHDELHYCPRCTAAVIWVCRGIPGHHAGGPDCFCCPTRLETDTMETTEQMLWRVEQDQGPQ